MLNCEIVTQLFSLEFFVEERGVQDRKFVYENEWDYRKSRFLFIFYTCEKSGTARETADCYQKQLIGKPT